MVHKNIRYLKIFNFLIGFSLFAPLAIIYYSKVAGSYTLGASIFGITMLASAIFEVPTGIWSDRVGRRTTLILGSWARVFAFIFYAIGLSYFYLVAGAIFEGLSRSFYSGNNDAFLYDSLADDDLVSEYDEHLGRANSTEQLALALSALLGGIVANFSFTYLLWVSVLSQIIMLFVSYQFEDTRTQSSVSTNVYTHLTTAIKLFIRNKKLRLLSLTSVINFSLSEMMYQFRASFIAMVWPVWAIGFANVMSNIGATISFYYSGRLIRRFSAPKILLLKSIWNKAISLISYAIISPLSPVLLASSSLLFGVGSVAESKLMQQEFSSQQRATMSSLNALLGNITFFVTSLLLGSLADRTNPATALFRLSLVSLPVILLYIKLFNFKESNV